MLFSFVVTPDCYSLMRRKSVRGGGAVFHSGGGMGGSKGWFVGVGERVFHRGGTRGVS